MCLQNKVLLTVFVCLNSFTTKTKMCVSDCVIESTVIVSFPRSLFAPISRQEAELIQQQAPPSYGQLIAQGIIPPVEDFPTENPNEVSKRVNTRRKNCLQGCRVVKVFFCAAQECRGSLKGNWQILC